MGVFTVTQSLEHGNSLVLEGHLECSMSFLHMYNLDAASEMICDELYLTALIVNRRRTPRM